MCWPVRLGGHRAHAAAWLIIGIVLSGTGAAFAQLSPEDIERLRKRGQEEGWTFTVGANPATRRPLHELCGAVEPSDWRLDAPSDPCYPQRDLPEYFDWRDYDGCTPIKNQGGCGSCWAFGAIGAMECAIRLSDGVTEDLSEQWLVSSCTAAGSCSGGWHTTSFNYLRCSGLEDPCGDSGAVLEADFPYTASDTPCGCPYPHPYCLDSWAAVGYGWGIPSVDQIKQAILDHGPVAVCVYVNSAFGAYTGDVFNACEDQSINHVVVLVGWDDNQGSEGVWFLRNSWGPGWGEDGYMRIEYNCSRVGYATAYVDYAGRLIAFEYPDGLPETLLFSEPTTVRVNVVPGYNGEPVPGTGVFYYRIDGGDWHVTIMEELEPNQYEATMPLVACGSVVEYYFSAMAAGGYTRTDPPLAPDERFSALVTNAIVEVLDDAFESDQGWTVGAADDDATAGIWERADPAGNAAQPEDDHTLDPGTICYVTDGTEGPVNAFDVDGGKTTLLSPVLDLEGVTDATIGYWRWYSNHISLPASQDVFVVDISNDGGANWTNVETLGPNGEETEGGWFYHEFALVDFVTPSPTVVLRFIASDEDRDSVIEAAIDDVTIVAYDCSPPCVGDLDGDGDTDHADLGILLGDWECSGEDCVGDLDGDGDTDHGDLGILLSDWECGRGA
jgi:C1A family cysteine protease